MLAFAGEAAFLAIAEARDESTPAQVGQRQYAEALAPLRRDLPALGIAPDTLIGYQDDYFRKPGGSGVYLHLTRLFLAPLRLEYTTEHEWLLVVRIENPVTGLDRAQFRKVKSYFGMTLWRRIPEGQIVRGDVGR